MLTILFDGVAYGMLLFVLACGLAVTLGLMNFVNLAHGVFAMGGGYVTALLMNRAGVPFLATLPFAFLVPALLGVVLERLLYRRLYGASPLDQVLLTIGLVLMAIPAFDYFLTDQPQQIHLPAYPAGPLRAARADDRRLSTVPHRRLRADRRSAAGRSWSARGSARNCALRSTTAASPRGSGIDVGRLFAIAFAIGSGLAGLGGALAADVVGGVDPNFPIKFMVSFLIVVAIGGSRGIAGALFGALLLGVLDVAGKYYVPSIGAFIIYAVMVATLLIRPHGLFAKSGT